MKKLLPAAIAVLLFSCAPKGEQTVTFQNEGNPLIRSCYTADPAPVVFDGRLYLYTGHDECFEDSVGYEGLYGFNLTNWLCFSSSDMQTWTEHGVVLSPADFSWASGEAWAAQVVEKDGKYWYYVSTQCADPNCKSIGVAVADTPTGPFKDAIGKPLIVDSMTPNAHPLGWWNDIDPTVFIDDDGTAWLSWGNGTCFLARLKPNMIELDSEIMTLPMENYVEGPWLYKRRSADGNTWWYMVYASMGNKGGETISYAMAPEVTGPWTFQGELTGPAQSSFTIHPGIVDFQGHTYLFYHNSTVSLHGYGPATGRRSVCYDEMFYNPDGTIRPVVQTSGKPENIQDGDLLFISLPSDYDLNDKSYVATSNVQNFIHVAMLEVENDEVYVIDATFKYGVDRHPLDTLLHQYTLRNGGLPRMEVKRLADSSEGRSAVIRAKHFLGAAYDTTFAPYNEALYCSELVGLCYSDAEGHLLFPLREMDLRTIPPVRRFDLTGQRVGPESVAEPTIPRYWTQLCASAGIPLPKGQGIMPADIYNSPLLRTVNVTISTK
ncbi:MAG: family 43 glycosylhydrolase [Prevotella sp.]|nr:family 43 glycosylhydrolase [Prevotella sp.]